MPRTRKTLFRNKQRPELDALIAMTGELVKAMPPAERAAMRAEQRRSWVRGEIGWAHPELSQEAIHFLVEDIEEERNTTMKSTLIDIALIVHHETFPGQANAGAVLVSIDGDRAKAVWLPKCAVEIELQKGLAIVTMPERLAIDKGLL